jgi:putative glutathione S-transferase
MKLMINGTWRGDIDPAPELDAQRMIHAGAFRDRITADGSSGFAAKAGRYHLYVSYACPFSHRVIMVRALKRLQGVVGLSVAHPLWNTPDGWVFGDTGLDARRRGQRLHSAPRGLSRLPFRLHRKDTCPGALGSANAPDHQQRIAGDRGNAR